MSRHPGVRWAQRSDKLYVTIDLPDTEDVKFNVDPDGKFFFSATTGADKIPYVVDISLYDNVDVKESKANMGARNICYLLKKAEAKWWPRLLKPEGKSPVFLKVDWEKWVDEDEEEEAQSDVNDTEGFDGIDFSKLNMGGGDDDIDIGAADDDELTDESDTEEDDDAMEAAPAGGVPEAKPPSGGVPESKS